jgi:bifunctional DNA-binding transcriptional regulator/antitoxin component of YhaV-PrlF toxin-antitoxin module
VASIVTSKEVTKLGDITSINKAATTNQSLRTTIPKSIVNQFGLTYKDKLEWMIKAEGGELIIQVKPIKL